MKLSHTLHRITSVAYYEPQLRGGAAGKEVKDAHVLGLGQTAWGAAPRLRKSWVMPSQAVPTVSPPLGLPSSGGHRLSLCPRLWGGAEEPGTSSGRQPPTAPLKMVCYGSISPPPSPVALAWASCCPPPACHSNANTFPHFLAPLGTHAGWCASKKSENGRSAAKQHIPSVSASRAIPFPLGFSHAPQHILAAAGDRWNGPGLGASRGGSGSSPSSYSSFCSPGL